MRERRVEEKNMKGGKGQRGKGKAKEKEREGEGDGKRGGQW